jgi:hypothetical protein
MKAIAMPIEYFAEDHIENAAAFISYSLSATVPGSCTIQDERVTIIIATVKKQQYG